MRIPALLFVTLYLAVATAFAMPIQVKVKDLVRQDEAGRVPMMPARVGWRDDAAAQRTPNLVYERLMYPQTPQGIREQWQEIARPRWEVFLGVFALIGCLRVLRQRDSQRRKPGDVLSMPEPGSGLRAA